nr:hypothetical protein [Tanacetum cinerariifolium]
KPKARSGLRRKQSSKHTSESTTKASKSQSGHSNKETKTSSAIETSPSHPSPFTPVVGKMHKEAQQAAGDPTSLRDTSEDGAHHQLSSGVVVVKAKGTLRKSLLPLRLRLLMAQIIQCLGGTNPSVLVDKTKSARDGLKATHTKTNTNLESSKTKKESKADEDVGFRDDEFNTSLDLSSLECHTNNSDEEVHAKKVHTKEPKETVDALASHPPSLKKAAKDDEKANLNKPIPTTTPATSTIPSIITTITTQLQSPFLPSLPNSSSQSKGELIKKDKGKKAMSSKDAEEAGAKSDSNDTINLASSMVESSETKKMKKFDFVTEGGEHVHFTEEQIKEHKRIEESIKADAAKQEVKARK